MAPGHILQIFLWVTVQNQIRIAQRVIVDEIVQFRPLFSFPKKTKNPNPSPIEKRFGFSILTAVLPVDIPTGPGTAHEQKPHWADCLRHCAAGPCGLRLLIFPQPLGRALKNQNAAPTTPPCFCRRQRSSLLLFKSSYPHRRVFPKGRMQKKNDNLFESCRLRVQECNPNPNHFSLMLLLQHFQT